MRRVKAVTLVFLASILILFIQPAMSKVKISEFKAEPVPVGKYEALGVSAEEFPLAKKVLEGFKAEPVPVGKYEALGVSAEEFPLAKKVLEGYEPRFVEV